MFVFVLVMTFSSAYRPPLICRGGLPLGWRWHEYIHLVSRLQNRASRRVGSYKLLTARVYFAVTATQTKGDDTAGFDQEVGQLPV